MHTICTGWMLVSLRHLALAFFLSTFNVRLCRHVCQRAGTAEAESRVSLLLSPRALTRQRNGELGQKLSQIAHFSKVPVGQAIPGLNLRLLLCQIWKKISDARTFPFEEWGRQTGLNIFDFGWEHHYVLTGKMITTRRNTVTGCRCNCESEHRDALSAGVGKANIPDIIGHTSIPRTQEISMINGREGTFKNAVASGQVQKGLGQRKITQRTCSSASEISLFWSLSRRGQGERL